MCCGQPENGVRLGKATPAALSKSRAIGQTFLFVRATGFLPRRWAKYVTARDKGEPPTVARPYYELALLTTLNERLKSGDVTVTHSRRWTDFEDYLIPRAAWAKEREQYYAKLGLPLQGEQYLVQLRAQLAAVTAEVDRRVPGNSALSIDAQKGEFHLAAQKGTDKPDEVKTLKELIESRLPRTELVDVLLRRGRIALARR
jgi:hypothetical protein